MTYTYDTLRVRVTRGVAFVSIDNPPINLVDAALVADLDRFNAEVREDETVRVVVFDSANPEFFLAHGDMRLIVDPAALAEFVAGPGAGLHQRYRDLPQITIAKITGRARALEAVLGADLFDAETAERYGWINRALPPDELDDYVDRLATRIAGGRRGGAHGDRRRDPTPRRGSRRRSRIVVAGFHEPRRDRPYRRRPRRGRPDPRRRTGSGANPRRERRDLDLNGQSSRSRWTKLGRISSSGASK